MKNINMLWELQQQEDKIIQIEKDAGITHIKKEISNFKQSYNKILSLIKQMADEYKQKESQVLDVKAEIVQVKEKITSDEEKLYNGTIKKVKALTQLQKEIDDNKGRVEEKGSIIEQYKNENLSLIKSIKKYKAKTEMIKEKINESTILLKDRIKDTEDQLMTVNKSIKEIRKVLTEEELKFYDDKKEKIYPVVVCYKEDVCDGCKMQFSLIFSQNIKKQDNKVFTCENCGRLIYIPEFQEA